MLFVEPRRQRQSDHEVFEELFIPKDSVCIDREAYLTLLRKRDMDHAAFIKLCHRLEWVRRYGSALDWSCLQEMLDEWIDELRREEVGRG